MKTLDLLQHKVTWLPEAAVYQMSFNKRYGRMYLDSFMRDKKNISKEVLHDWGLISFLRDETFQYFTTLAVKEEFEKGGEHE